MTTETHHPIYTTSSGADMVTGLDMNALDDWNEIVRVFRAEFNGRRVSASEGRKLFPGHNFMTEEVLGYVHTPRGIAEVSTSHRGLLTDHRVFGVTFADPGPDGKGGESDPSCYCEEWGDVVNVCNADA